MNIRAKLIGCLFAASVMFITSVPVYAAPGDGVIYLADATAASPVITIDGSYTDWEDMPLTKIFGGPEPGTHFYQGALFRGVDNGVDYVYLHIIASQDVPGFWGFGYHFTVDDLNNNNGSYVDAVLPAGETMEVGINAIKIRRQNGNRLIDDANGIVTRLTGQPDEWELRIPLSAFSSQVDRIRTITFGCLILGPQVLTSTGTPTWPYLVAGTGVAIAFAGYMLSKRKRAK